ncbi:hypothetical protein [Neosynechococcus sphagnicola]|uniref:hypothetical protein n=1 Tax=Neosynechococcus sphagnicola TaxID=1501145 RepID=UPI00068E2455|nr:hypothetical protein [Neosynechococcus sphagnicola]
MGTSLLVLSSNPRTIRIAGTLSLVDAAPSIPILQQDDRATWHDLLEAARRQFTWPTSGGTHQDQAFPALPPSPTDRLPMFCLLLLQPRQVDHLELQLESQTRWIDDQQQPLQGAVRWVNP